MKTLEFKGIVVEGNEFPEGTMELTARLWLFSQGGEEQGVMGGEDRYRHLKRAVDLAFNCEGSIRRVIWNRWTERMLRGLVGDWREKRFVGLAGCSSSGKSDVVALYGLMEYWARPSDTYFIVMSTTKQSARMRIWKSVTELWGQAGTQGIPGKLNDSDGYIKGVDRMGRLTRNSGIVLMAAGLSEADETCRNLMGVKARNVVIGLDEGTDVGPGILTTASENMTVNERITFVMMGNPNMLTDPFGNMNEPVNGWKSITINDIEWETRFGMCLRFNAEDSPRIMEPGLVDEKGKHLYFWQPDKAYCENVARLRGGTKSRGYYRYVLAFWCPEGASNTIYSEVELMTSIALDLVEPEWDATPVLLTSLDPAFSSGGDRNQTGIGKVGKVGGKTRFHVSHEHVLTEDLENKEIPLTHQIVRKWKEYGVDQGITPNHAVMDNTGSGISFGHVVDVEWSPYVVKINFKNKADETRVVVFRSEEVQYFNMNSQLWIQPKEYFRSNQISGVSKELLGELVTREFSKKEGRTLRVEDKVEAKTKNGGKSPDLADMFLMLVELAIRLGLLKSEEVKTVSKMANRGWQKARAKWCVSSNRGKRLMRS
jgi:hypothetical protein